MKATRQQLEALAQTILIDAIEGWTCSTWALRDDYQWGTDNGLYELSGENPYASVVLYDLEELTEVTEEEFDALPEEKRWVGGFGNHLFRLDNPLFLTHTHIADFIEKIGKGEFSQDNVPDHGRLSNEVVTALAGAYLFGEDGIEGFHDINDAIVSDCIVQFITLGEVVYG